MRPAAGFIITCLMLTAFYVPATSPAADESKPKDEVVWIILDAKKDPGQPDTRSALPFVIKSETETKPLRAEKPPQTEQERRERLFAKINELTNRGPTYDHRDLRRSFSLEKTRFLEGEPILVRFAIELDGEGTWIIRDWMYHNNRDETFLLLLKDADGNWIPDRYHRPMLFLGGGHQPFGEFSKDNPEVHWLPLQQYCALAKPSKYDLYCLKCLTKGFESPKLHQSPLFDELPDEILELAEERIHPLVAIENLTDYAHFKIEIVSGTEAERTKMIREWGDFQKEDLHAGPWRSRSNAAWRSWKHSLRNDFLPHLWSYYSDWSTYEFDDGVKRPFVLMLRNDKADRWSWDVLSRAEVAKQIPEFIDQLASKDPVTRSTAEFHLRKWCKVSFGHTWTGHRYERPTLAEGRQIQKQWRQWWQQHEAAFRQTRD